MTLEASGKPREKSRLRCFPARIAPGGTDARFKIREIRHRHTRRQSEALSGAPRGVDGLNLEWTQRAVVDGDFIKPSIEIEISFGLADRQQRIGVRYGPSIDVRGNRTAIDEESIIGELARDGEVIPLIRKRRERRGADVRHSDRAVDVKSEETRIEPEEPFVLNTAALIVRHQHPLPIRGHEIGPQFNRERVRAKGPRGIVWCLNVIRPIKGKPRPRDTRPVRRSRLQRSVIGPGAISREIIAGPPT